MTNRTKGIIAIIIASFGFAWMSIFVKLAGDIPVFQKVFFRNIISMFFALIMITINNEPLLGKKQHQRLLLLRSALGTTGMVLFFYSIDQLVAADANMLNKLSSFFLILFSFLILKEKITKYQLIAIIIAFLGSLLIIKPQFDIQMVPYITSIAAAMFAGGAYTVLRTLGTKEKYYTVVFYFSAFSVIVLAPFVIFQYQSMTPMQWIYLMLTGVGATIGQFGTTIAYKYAPASEISIFNYTNVVFVTIFAIPFLGEIPDVLSIVGYLIIFVASYFMFRHQNMLKST